MGSIVTPEVKALFDKAGLDEEQVAELVSDFKEMDVDGNGTVTQDEVRDLLKKERVKMGGEAPSEEEVASMMKDFDIDGDGRVTFSEYVKVLTS